MTLCFFAFVLILFGTVEFAWGVFAYNSVAYLAQDAARWASVNGSLSPSPATADSVTSYVKNEAVGLTQNLVTVSTNWSPNNSPGSTVTVTVGYTMNPLVGLTTRTMNLASTAQFYINH